MGFCCFCLASAQKSISRMSKNFKKHKRMTALEIGWMIVKLLWYAVLAAIAIRLIMAIIFDK